MACAQCCCICTLCISQCVASFQLANYAVKLGEAVKESKEAADIKTSIELHVVPQPCVSERSWVDSKGLELTVGEDPLGLRQAAGLPEEPSGAVKPLGGPPYGYSLIITIEAPYDPKKWPPGGNQPPTVPSVTADDAPPAAESAENNV